MTLPSTAPPVARVAATLTASTQPAPRAPDSAAAVAGQPAIAPASTGQRFSSMIDAMGTVGGPAPSLSAAVGEASQLLSIETPAPLTANVSADESGQASPPLPPLPQLLQRAPAAISPFPASIPGNAPESPENNGSDDTVLTMMEAPIDHAILATGQPSGIDSQPAPRPLMQPAMAGEAARPTGGERADAGTGLPIETASGAKPDVKTLLSMPVDPLARSGATLPEPVADRPTQPMPGAPDRLDERWITSLALAVDRAADGEGPDLTFRSANLGLIQFGLDKTADSFVLKLNASSDSSAALMAAAQDRLLRDAMAQNVRLSVIQPGTEQSMGNDFASAGEGRGHGAPMAHDSGQGARALSPVAPDWRELEQSVDHVAGNIRHRFA